MHCAGLPAMSKETPARIFVPYSQLHDVLGIRYTRVHINRLIRAGCFPAPRKLSENRIAWVYSDLIEWAENRERVRKGVRPRVRMEDEEKADRYARKRERLA
jgi:predicted DNA-binding transcriptional regulator AlpA